MHVMIAGGGIGGLVAALSLHQAGIEVTVYEAAQELKPMGVGINILPHAARELIELGLEQDIDAFAIRTSAMNYYTASGQLVISQPCGTSAGYHWPQWSLHRGDLHMLLLRAFKERAGAGKVITDAALASFQQDDSGVDATFTQRSKGRPKTARGDVLIGADGLHSQTRRILYPQEGDPMYCGMVLYRAAAEAPAYLDGKTMIIVGDKRLRLVAYPMSSALQRDGKGRALINWIGVLPMDQDAAPEENWDQQSHEQKLTQRYKEWTFDWIDVPQILGASDQIFEFPVYDRDPIERWTFGRVALLGDAAHPLIPVSSSGAVQAILDGRALAYALATQPDAPSGLKAYEADRLPTANATVRSSRENGPDEVLEIVHQRCPPGTTDVHAHVPLSELQTVIDTFKERTGFGVETLNARHSYSLT
ncbi:MAG: flavin-dependent oxidoreductase [Pseudomonadota bacterium]